MSFNRQEMARQGGASCAVRMERTLRRRLVAMSEQAVVVSLVGFRCRARNACLQAHSRCGMSCGDARPAVVVAGHRPPRPGQPPSLSTTDAERAYAACHMMRCGCVVESSGGKSAGGCMYHCFRRRAVARRAVAASLGSGTVASAYLHAAGAGLVVPLLHRRTSLE